jgi:hypothetical protein
MKALWQFIAPAVKAVYGVIAIMFTVVAASYGGIVLIAKSEAQAIESKMLAVRQADMEHLNTRFDDTHKLLREIKREIRKIK